jgi:hypothetical protein
MDNLTVAYRGFSYLQIFLFIIFTLAVNILSSYINEKFMAVWGVVKDVVALFSSIKY